MKTMSKHIKYPKIPTHNSTQGKAMLKYVEEKFGADAKFHQTEKLHGTNFGYYLNAKGNTKYASRNIFVGNDYYKAQKVINDVDKKCQGLFADIKRIVIPSSSKSELKHVILYGEIIGKGVQKGMTYDMEPLNGKDNRAIVFFDMLLLIKSETNTLINTEHERTEDGLRKFWCSFAGVFYKELVNRDLNVIKYGKSFVALNDILNNEYENTPSQYCKNESLREGDVWKFESPNEYGQYGERLVFKKKNKQFAEIDRTKKAPARVEIDKGLADHICQHVCQNRLDAVLSKYGMTKETFNPRDFSDILYEMVADIKEDFENPNMLNKDENKFIHNQCAKFMRHCLLGD